MKNKNIKKLKNWLFRTVFFYILLLPFGYGLKQISIALILAIFAGLISSINDTLKKAIK